MLNLRIYLCYFACICIVLNILSCQRNNSDTTEILVKLEESVEKKPDSVLSILDSIIDPYILKEEDYNKFLLLQIQAKDKSYKDISSDTLLFQVKDYYLKKNDIDNTALASYYCGRILQEQKRYNEAVAYYLDAEKYATQINNHNLIGLSNSSIGGLLSIQFTQDEAITKFKEAIQAFRKARNQKNEIISCINIGNCFLIKSKNDSALYYYGEALKYADLYQLKKEQMSVRNNLSIAYQEMGNHDKSLYYLREALTFASDDYEKTKIYLNLAKTSKDKDSISYYIQRSLILQQEEKDPYLSSSAYNVLSSLEEKNMNYKKALEYHKAYTNYLATILNQNKDNRVSEIQKKYNFELIQNKYNKLTVQRLEIIVVFSICLLALALIALFYYRKSYKNKKAMLTAENAAIESENKALWLIEMSKSFNDKEASFRNILLHHFDILKKAALLESHLKKGDENQYFIKKINDIVYGQEALDWDVLYRTINNLYNGFFDKLRKKYPQLDETEFRICCLIYTQFSSSEIAVITQLSVNTIHMKRTSIRKKIGIEHSGNISDFLRSNIT